MGAVGGKIAALREAHNLSVEELAERCGCEASIISSLESGEIAPSLAPLIQITRALGVRLGTLVDDDTELGPVVTRSAEADPSVRMKSLQTASDAGKLDFFSLAEGKGSRHMEPFMITVHPVPADEHKLSGHEGEEFLFVLDGALEVEYGKDLHVLNVGDSIYYDSIVPHQVRAHGEGDARILAVVYTPL